MDGRYPPMPPIGAFYANGQPVMPPDAFPPGLHQLQTMSSESSLNNYADFDNGSRTAAQAHSAPRSRRRQPQGPEHTKHRRTRSGCYTCRQRRVKCDEEKPTCDRCRKGNRECQYPDTSASSKSVRTNLKSKGSFPDSGSNSSGDDYDESEKYGLSSIPDDDEDADSLDFAGPPTALKREAHGSRKSSDASPIQKVSSASTEASSSFNRNPSRPQATRTNSNKQSMRTKLTSNSKWAILPKDVQFYLRYHRNHLSYHHYAFKHDSGDFLKTTFLEIAMNDEPLMYAVVGFAAYHHTLALPNGKMSSFLKYYDKSLNLLRTSLERNKRHTTTTLLTILQLATFEEFLGDWVNLLGHQKAAFEILTELYTPETIMQSETHRKIISWYIRFDLFAGLMSGYKTVLGREWFAAHTDYYKRQARDRPNDIGARFEEYFATTRLLATDVALIFAAKTKGDMSDQEFGERCQELAGDMAQFAQTLETAYTKSSYFVKSFPKAIPPYPEQSWNPRDPDFLYAGDMFTMNFVLIDFWAIHLMFKYQMTMAQQLPPSGDLQELAFKMCKMVDATECYDQSPLGSLLGTQASLGIASLFLPKDEMHKMWCRRYFAVVEQKGYIYPATMRTRMGELWGEDVSTWWLPNNEGFPPIIQSIREFIEFRSQEATDTLGASVRDMKALFNRMNLDESSPKDMKGLSTDSEFEPQFDGMMYESSPDNWPS